MRNTLVKAMAALRDRPEWSFVLAYDELQESVVLFIPPPWGESADDYGDFTRIARRWEYLDAISLAASLQGLGIFRATPGVAERAAELVAREVRSFHPVRLHLASLVAWDGTPRLDHWLTQYLGAEDTPHVRDAGSRWLISAVARVMQRGRAAPRCLVLQSPRVLGLSEALRILGGLWYRELVAGIPSRDAIEDIHGSWIVEATDAEDVTAAQAKRLKAFIARSRDRRGRAERPRQCVFAITGRRLGDEWRPIQCGKIDLAGLERDRDQLWAEAHAKYKAGAL